MKFLSSNAFSGFLLAFLAIASCAQAFYTSDSYWVSKCPSSKRVVDSACAYANAVPQGVCDNCATPTKTGQTVSPAGNCVKFHYSCPASPNQPCGVLGTGTKVPTAAQKAEYPQTCVWAPRSGAFQIFSYKCPAGYKIVTPRCTGVLQPACRCEPQ